MTREKEIEQAANGYLDSLFGGGRHHDLYIRLFMDGARWADQHPNAIDFTYLQNWYQDSIDEEKEPIWTDKHLEELFNDFYLIPKKTNNYGFLSTNNVEKILKSH